MQFLNNKQVDLVSGGGFGTITALVNVWAGYDNWDYSTLMNFNVGVGATSGFIIGTINTGSPIGGVAVSILGGAIAAAVTAIEYRVGAYVDTRQKAKWAEFHAAQHA